MRRPRRSTGRPPRCRGPAAARGVYGFRPRTWGRAGGTERGTGGATGAGAARRRRRRLRRRRVPPRGRRVGGRWGRTRRCRGCGRVVPGDGVGRGGIGPGPRRLPGRPARANATRAPRSCLVLRPMLARVRVLLGVERPVGARRRAVPRGTAPVGGEGVGIDIVVRGRPEGRLLASSFAGVARLTGTRGPRTAACRAASVCRCRAAGALRRRRTSGTRWPAWTGPRSRSRSRPATVRSIGRAGPVGVGLPGAGACGSRRGAAVAVVRPDDPVIRVLDREEARQCGLAGGVRMVRFHQSPIGAFDLVERRSPLESERAIRVVGWHRFGRGSQSGPQVGSPVGRRPAGQPISSPTGASSKSAMDSAPTRPCGSRIVGRW